MRTGTPTQTRDRKPGARRIMGLAGLLLGAALGLAPPGAAQAGQPSVSQAYSAYARGDYERAGILLVPLAARGESRAQALLGYLYEHGKGLPQNFDLAAEWYGCAAEQGEATAQYFLGLLYNKGHGVPRDVVLSQKWLILAAARASRAERDTYTRMRDAVASKMSTAQRALAQQLATDWFPAPPLPHPLP